MTKYDKYYGVFFFLLGLLLYIAVPKQIPTQSVGTVGPGVFPQTMAMLMMAASVGMIISCIYKDRHHMFPDTKPDFKAALKKEIPVVIAIGIFLVYAFLLTRIGFIPSTLLCGMSFMVLLRNKKWWLYLIFTIITFAVYGVFKYLLYIQLP